MPGFSTARTLMLAGVTCAVAGPVCAQTAAVRASDIPSSSATTTEETLSADANGQMTLRAERLQAPLEIDGRLDEEIYRRVAPAGNFIQNDTEPGTSATEQTD